MIRIFTISRLVLVLLLVVSLQSINATEMVDPSLVGKERNICFDTALPQVSNPSSDIDYNFDLSKESFQAFLPKNYSGKEAFGIFIFIDSQNEMMMPKEWASIMEKEKLICLIPQKIGNDQPLPRRLGLTLVGILKLEERYKIDPKRVFVGGFSGGARCSVNLAFLHSDLIAGNVSICGADFYRPVRKVKASDNLPYGISLVPSERANNAKTKVLT